jgi:hypothetical protein
MNPRSYILFGWVALVALLATLAGHGLLPSEAKTRAKKKKTAKKQLVKKPQAWTFDEALSQLKLTPHDAYLQYVALQLARRENRLERAVEEIDQLTSVEDMLIASEGRRHQVDLFSLFTGALAVQESLQLDTMRGDIPRRRGPEGRIPEKELEQDKDVKKQKDQSKKEERAKDKYKSDKAGQKNSRKEKRPQQTIAVTHLRGPTIKSHPWKKMLGGKAVKVSSLSRSVPEDFYLAEFRSLTRLLDALDVNDLWAKHLFNQAVQDARTQQIGERLKTQLVLETEPLFRKFYDLVVDQVAVCGSDPFLREGSDVTLLFRFRQEGVFKARMASFANNARKARPDVERKTGKFHGVAYEHLGTPDRQVCVYAAYPEEGLHVRSNSQAAFQRIVEAIKGKKVDGKPVRRLGDTVEFQYIRTLLPWGAKEEDGFVYLSDPFIRRLVGPQVKLTERRRVLCFNHLKMIGHAALLYRMERGKAPASLAALAKAKCCPEKFNAGKLTCPCGGTYSLSPDGMGGVCSYHGNSQFLTPCLEIPLANVARPEADEYEAFVKDYNQYWKTYFDPIALRLTITPARHQVETIVLPLIDNSVYTGLAKVLGGRPEPLDALPVPRRNILSLNVRLNKTPVLKEANRWFNQATQAGEIDFQEELRKLGVPAKDAKKLTKKKIREFLGKGLGNQVGFHFYDAAKAFDLNLPALFGELMGTFTQNGAQVSGEIFSSWLMVGGLLIASLNSPVYMALPVQDGRIVDDFLDSIDIPLAALARQQARGGFFRTRVDFYRVSRKGQLKVRALALQFGPVKWRFFWCRIGDGLYLASKPFILEDLWAARQEVERAKKGDAVKAKGPSGHALVRVRPQHWQRVLPDSRLAWAENNRAACLKNLGPISYAGRALAASSSPRKAGADNSWDRRGRKAHQFADQLHGVHFFCPEGGHYLLSADGKSCQCSIHGSTLAPRQPAAPNDDSALGKLMKDFADMTATLTFREDGLHAVVTIERKKPSKE